MNEDVFEKEIVQNFRVLPPEKKKEALDFLQFLRSRFSSEPRSTLKGLWKNLQIDIDDKDLADSRYKVWSSFPTRASGPFN